MDLENDNTQTTLRDVISNAMDEVQTDDAAQSESVSRDEKGRFAAKQAEEQTQAEKPQAELAQEQVQTTEQPVIKPRPSSWKKDYEEHWTKLDPALQDYIAQRESDYARGVSQYKQNFEAVQPIYEAMQPYMPLLQEHNIQPDQWISNLGAAHKALALGSPEEKLQIFSKLAMDYGVPLQALTGQQYDPQQSLLMNELNQVKSQLNQFQSLQEQQQIQNLEKLVNDFSKDKPFIAEVEDTMLELLQTGFIKGATPEERLQSAYDKAIRLHDDVWQKQKAEAQQANAQTQAQQSQQKVADAKAKAVSPKSVSPTANMNSGNSKKDLRELLSDSFDAVTASRV